MGVLVALIIGYVLGAKTGGKDLDQLGQSVKALSETTEFGDVVAAARSHVGHTLRELATLVDRDGAEPVRGSDGAIDLVDRVRHIVERS